MMTDSEVIDKLKESEFGTGIIIRDTDGNEYFIKGIGVTMGGSFHQVIELERIPKNENWFRTLEQRISDAYNDIDEYRKALEECNNIEDCDVRDHSIDIINRCIKSKEYCIKIYKDKLDDKESKDK